MKDDGTSAYCGCPINSCLSFSLFYHIPLLHSTQSKTIEACLDSGSAEAYRIVFEGKNAGGIILQINPETNHNELDILFVLPEFHSRGIGYGAWLAAEKLHPETKVWETCTPYFDKRNIHFYVNKCGFVIDRFWCEYFKPDFEIPDGAPEDEGPDEMFRFIKVMRR